VNSAFNPGHAPTTADKKQVRKPVGADYRRTKARSEASIASVAAESLYTSTMYFMPQP
jgi:hypothetical protein